jgi:transcriptional regulator with XRE-family HTH domain
MAPAELSSESEARAPGRRFAPSRRRRVTEGGTVYGTLVADQRAKRGLTQRQLAAIVQTSPSTITRIEHGHPPSAEIRRRLEGVLTTEPPNPVRQAISRAWPRRRPRMPRLSRRWLWGGVAVVSILIALVLVGRLSGSDSSASTLQPSLADLGSDSSASTLQPSLADAAAPADLAAVHRARTRAENVAAAKARRAAERRREREAAAAAAAAAAARKAAAKAERHSTVSDTPRFTAPIVAPSPAPSGGGGGGGGGGSSAPAPGLTHGIGASGD